MKKKNSKELPRAEVKVRVSLRLPPDLQGEIIRSARTKGTNQTVEMISLMVDGLKSREKAA